MRANNDIESMIALVAELKAAGYSVESVDELRTSGARYATAVPLLLKALPALESDRSRETVVRALSVPWAKAEALEPLLTEYERDAADCLYRWAVGDALWVLWDDGMWDRLAALARNERFGRAREMVVLGLGKSKDPRSADLLIELLRDPVVDGHAVKALQKLKPTHAANALAPFADDKRAWVRKSARATLSILERQ